MIEAVDLRGFIEENASCGGHIYVVSLSDMMHTVGPLLHVFEHAHFVHGYRYVLVLHDFDSLRDWNRCMYIPLRDGQVEVGFVYHACMFQLVTLR